jgi:hypothetical protein
LSNVAQPDCLFALAGRAQLDLQALYDFWIQLASATQLTQIVRQLLNCLEDLCFKARDIVRFVSGRGPAWLANGWG